MKTHYPTTDYEWGYKYRIVEHILEHKSIFSIEEQFLWFFWINRNTKYFDSLEEALEALKEKIKPKKKKLYHYVRYNLYKGEK